MGNDGGDIPGRKELVREKQKVQPPNAESIAMGRYYPSNPELGSAPSQITLSHNLSPSADSDISITTSKS